MAAGDPPSFLPAVDYSVGATAFTVSTDLNDDGYDDLVASDSGDEAVKVLMAAGDGTFDPATSYSAGPAGPMAAGDLNDDGFPDVVVANSTDQVLGVLLGAGDGSLAAPVTYAAGISKPSYVVISDVDDDQIPDLVVAGATSASFGVLLGNGDGTFQGAVTYTTGSVIKGDFAMGKVNDDEYPDIVFAKDVSDQGYVSVMLNNGDGTFGLATDFPAGAAASDVVLGDLNGDGFLDAVTADADTEQVGVLLGVGDGTFGAATMFPTGDDPKGLALGDFNGDTELDIALGSLTDMQVLPGNGDGTFEAATSFTMSDSVPMATPGDFNDDGLLDLAAPLINSTAVGVLINDGPPSITSVDPSVGPVTGGTAITVTGTGFADGTTLTVGGTEATDVQFVGGKSITAVTPAGSVGAQDVVVTRPDTKTGTASGAFTYEPLPTPTPTPSPTIPTPTPTPTPTPSPSPTKIKRKKLPLKVAARPAAKKVKRSGVTTVVKRAKTSSKGRLSIAVRITPRGSSVLGEVPYGRAYISRKGQVKVRTFGHRGVRVKVSVQAVPKDSYADAYKANTWRRTWRVK